MDHMHTPGPWFTFKTIDDCGNRLQVIATVASSEEVDHSLMVNDFDPTIAGVHSNDTVDVANAKLIAAAPQLLKALEWVTKCSKSNGKLGITWYAIGDKYMQAAKDAVAKAKGETP